MSGFVDYLAMGSHGAYVWSAYGLALLVLAGLLVWTLWSLRAREAELRVLEADAPHRRPSGDSRGPT